MWKLFFLVVSLTAVSFGGGNTLLAGLERELVQTGVISPKQFAVAVALGQSTPGPLAAFTTAVGSAVAGFGGAVAATLALIVVQACACKGGAGGDRPRRHGDRLLPGREGAHSWRVPVVRVRHCRRRGGSEAV